MDAQKGELKLSEFGAKKLGLAKEAAEEEEENGGGGMYGMELRVKATDGGGKEAEQMV
jgi:hypothetical protein